METLEQLQLKKTQVEHQITRLENRKNYLDKAERKARAHRLITKGAAIESIVPAAKASHRSPVQPTVPGNGCSRNTTGNTAITRIRQGSS